MPKFEIKINVEGIKEGGTYPKDSDVTITANINSTHDIKSVGLLINGERVSWIRKKPFAWFPNDHLQLKNLKAGAYVFEFAVTDTKGNKVEKMIKIKVQ